MGLQLDGLVGSARRADSTQGPFRQGRYSEMVVGQAGGKYRESTMRGEVFNAQTAATGVAPGTALGTTAAFCLHNPAGSGVLLVVQKLGMGLISGTLGAGVVHICSSNLGDAVPTGTAITPRSRYPGSGESSVALAFTTATITTNAAKQIGILVSLNQLVIATTATNPVDFEKDIDGEIVIGEGYNITLHSTAAAGSSPLVVFNATWQEVANS